MAASPSRLPLYISRPPTYAESWIIQWVTEAASIPSRMSIIYPYLVSFGPAVYGKEKFNMFISVVTVYPNIVSVLLYGIWYSIPSSILYFKPYQDYIYQYNNTHDIITDSISNHIIISSSSSSSNTNINTISPHNSNNIPHTMIYHPNHPHKPLHFNISIPTLNPFISPIMRAIPSLPPPIVSPSSPLSSHLVSMTRSLLCNQSSPTGTAISPNNELLVVLRGLSISLYHLPTIVQSSTRSSHSVPPLCPLPVAHIFLISPDVAHSSQYNHSYPIIPLFVSNTIFILRVPVMYMAATTTSGASKSRHFLSLLRQGLSQPSSTDPSYTILIYDLSSYIHSSVREDRHATTAVSENTTNVDLSRQPQTTSRIAPHSLFSSLISPPLSPCPADPAHSSTLLSSSASQTSSLSSSLSSPIPSSSSLLSQTSSVYTQDMPDISVFDPLEHLDLFQNDDDNNSNHIHIETTQSTISTIIDDDQSISSSSAATTLSLDTQTVSEEETQEEEYSIIKCTRDNPKMGLLAQLEMAYTSSFTLPLPPPHTYDKYKPNKRINTLDSTKDDIQDESMKSQTSMQPSSQKGEVPSLNVSPIHTIPLHHSPSDSSTTSQMIAITPSIANIDWILVHASACAVTCHILTLSPSPRCPHLSHIPLPAPLLAPTPHLLPSALCSSSSSSLSSSSTKPTTEDNLQSIHPFIAQISSTSLDPSSHTILSHIYSLFTAQFSAYRTIFVPLTTHSLPSPPPRHTIVSLLPYPSRLSASQPSSSSTTTTSHDCLIVTNFGLIHTLSISSLNSRCSLSTVSLHDTIPVSSSSPLPSLLSLTTSSTSSASSSSSSRKQKYPPVVTVCTPPHRSKPLIDSIESLSDIYTRLRRHIDESRSKHGKENTNDHKSKKTNNTNTSKFIDDNDNDNDGDDNNNHLNIAPTMTYLSPINDIIVLLQHVSHHYTHNIAHSYDTLSSPISGAQWVPLSSSLSPLSSSLSPSPLLCLTLMDGKILFYSPEQHVIIDDNPYCGLYWIVLLLVIMRLWHCIDTILRMLHQTASVITKTTTETATKTSTAPINTRRSLISLQSDLLHLLITTITAVYSPLLSSQIPPSLHTRFLDIILSCSLEPLYNPVTPDTSHHTNCDDSSHLPPQSSHTRSMHSSRPSRYIIDINSVPSAPSISTLVTFTRLLMSPFSPLMRYAMVILSQSQSLLHSIKSYDPSSSLTSSYLSSTSTPPSLSTMTFISHLSQTVLSNMSSLSSQYTTDDTLNPSLYDKHSESLMMSSPSPSSSSSSPSSQLASLSNQTGILSSISSTLRSYSTLLMQSYTLSSPSSVILPIICSIIYDPYYHPDLPHNDPIAGHRSSSLSLYPCLSYPSSTTTNSIAYTVYKVDKDHINNGNSITNNSSSSSSSNNNNNSSFMLVSLRSDSTLAQTNHTLSLTPIRLRMSKSGQKSSSRTHSQASSSSSMVAPSSSLSSLPTRLVSFDSHSRSNSNSSSTRALSSQYILSSDPFLEISLTPSSSSTCNPSLNDPFSPPPLPVAKSTDFSSFASTVRRSSSTAVKSSAKRSLFSLPTNDDKLDDSKLLSPPRRLSLHTVPSIDHTSSQMKPSKHPRLNSNTTDIVNPLSHHTNVDNIPILGDDTMTRILDTQCISLPAQSDSMGSVASAVDDLSKQQQHTRDIFSKRQQHHNDDMNTTPSTRNTSILNPRNTTQNMEKRRDHIDLLLQPSPLPHHMDDSIPSLPVIYGQYPRFITTSLVSSPPIPSSRDMPAGWPLATTTPPTPHSSSHLHLVDLSIMTGSLLYLKYSDKCAMESSTQNTTYNRPLSIRNTLRRHDNTTSSQTVRMNVHSRSNQQRRTRITVEVSTTLSRSEYLRLLEQERYNDRILHEKTLLLPYIYSIYNIKDDNICITWLDYYNNIYIIYTKLLSSLTSTSLLYKHTAMPHVGHLAPSIYTARLKWSISQLVRFFTTHYPTFNQSYSGNSSTRISHVHSTLDEHDYVSPTLDKHDDIPQFDDEHDPIPRFDMLSQYSTSNNAIVSSISTGLPCNDYLIAPFQLQAFLSLPRTCQYININSIIYIFVIYRDGSLALLPT